jgi:hypothetical protein
MADLVHGRAVRVDLGEGGLRAMNEEARRLAHRPGRVAR